MVSFSRPCIIISPLLQKEWLDVNHKPFELKVDGQYSITIIHYKAKYDVATSGFEMRFAIGSRHLWCWGQNTPRIQPS